MGDSCDGIRGGNETINLTIWDNTNAYDCEPKTSENRTNKLHDLTYK